MTSSSPTSGDRLDIPCVRPLLWLASALLTSTALSVARAQLDVHQCRRRSRCGEIRARLLGFRGLLLALRLVQQAVEEPPRAFALLDCPGGLELRSEAQQQRSQFGVVRGVEVREDAAPVEDGASGLPKRAAAF